MKNEQIAHQFINRLRMKGIKFLINFVAASVFMAAFNPVLSQKAQTWQTLFDGKSISGWHNYNKQDISGWVIEKGALTPDGTGGDLVTDKEYENFVLEFEFKIPPASNSGVLYKVIETPEIKRTVFSAPEYQIIDDEGYIFRGSKGEPIKVDANGDSLKLKATQLTGANYDMNPPLDRMAVKKPGSWNKARIVVSNNHIEHYLNGKKVVDYMYGDESWKALVAKSKYAEWPYASPHSKGKIALQNHNAREKVWFRNIRVKELE
jgi:hypothetical protein